jgi:hypothetical protein
VEHLYTELTSVCLSLSLLLSFIEGFSTVKIHIADFWVEIPYSLVDEYQLFGRIYSIHLQGAIYFSEILVSTCGVGIAQSVSRLITGWTAEGSDFVSW